ncbi:hypothetical protein [Ornithinimicrobium cavernae]|uniref:hypothetical protein n=1 Tax=Ornithinimicrobium cavernae TaxID=2666047 RepID=UPI000D69F307|nr:hypothetical protein [Ornithinimicrobium cavernae]
MMIESPEPTGTTGRVPLSADEPAPPGNNLADLVDEMEDRVLHGAAEEAQQEKEQTDAEEEAPAPEDVDPSGGKPV